MVKSTLSRISELTKKNSFFKYISIMQFFVLVLASFYLDEKKIVLLETVLLLSILAGAFVEDGDENQFFSIVIIFFLIFIGGILDPYSDKTKQKLIIIYGFVMLFSISIMLFRIISKSFKKKKIVIEWVCVMIIATFIVVSLTRLHSFPLYDGGAYFKACGDIKSYSYKFNFTPLPLVDYLLAQHISMGYSIFVLIGELFTPCLAEGIVVVNILLAGVSIGCFYRMMKRMGVNSTMAGLATSCYAFSPFVFGMVQTINTDVPSIWFWIIMIDMLVEGKNILFLCSSWAFVCTKEPNVIVYCFTILGALLYEIKEKAKLPSFSKFALYVAAPIFWLLYYLAPGRTSYVSSTEGIFNSTGLHTLGFSWANTVEKLKQIFVLNFSWVSVVIILVIVASSVVNKRGGTVSMATVAITFSLFGSLAFNIFYLDYLHPRYVALASVIFLSLALTMLVLADCVKNSHRVVALSFLLVLLLIQSFCSIDVVSNSINERCNVSESNTLVTPGIQAFNDSLIYNGEWYFFQRNIERALDVAEFSEGDCLVTQPFTYCFGDCINWNSHIKRMQTSGNHEYIYMINICEDLEEALERYNRMIVYVPYFQTGDIYRKMDSVVEMGQAEVTYSTEVKYGTFSGNVYVLVKK